MQALQLPQNRKVGFRKKKLRCLSFLHDVELTQNLLLMLTLKLLINLLIRIRRHLKGWIISSVQALQLPKNHRVCFRKKNCAVWAGVPMAFKTWCGHQYRVGIICPSGWDRVKVPAKTWCGHVPTSTCPQAHLLLIISIGSQHGSDFSILIHMCLFVVTVWLLKSFLKSKLRNDCAFRKYYILLFSLLSKH